MCIFYVSQDILYYIPLTLVKMSTEGQMTPEEEKQAVLQAAERTLPAAPMAAPRDKSRGLLIVLAGAVVVVIILLIMFFVGGGLNITMSEVALGLGAAAAVGAVAFVVGKRAGDTLSGSAKHYMKKL